jgi:hypothetical protein
LNLRDKVFVLKAAGNRGIDAQRAVPFVVSGVLPRVLWHVDFSDPEFTLSGHVDEYRVAKGAVLTLPRK